jgi:HAMP domain-containing protein
MRLSLRTKQVLGVTALVGAVVVVLSLIDLGQQARVRLEESQARGVLLAQAIYQRAFAIVPEAADPYYALREDGGMRNILEASIYSKGVTYAAIADTSGIVIAHYDPEQIGKPLQDADPLLDDLVKLGWMAELYEIFFGDGRTYEVREPLKIGRLAGVTRIGISTLLIRNVLQETLQPVFIRALYLLAGATLGALLLAQWLLRPIHVLRSGLKRLERGLPAAELDLPQDEFGELGRELSAVSEKLLKARGRGGPPAECRLDRREPRRRGRHLRPKGDPLFVNPALRVLLQASERDGSHPFRDLVDRTLDSRLHAEPTTMTLPAGEETARTTGR